MKKIIAAVAVLLFAASGLMAQSSRDLLDELENKEVKDTVVSRKSKPEKEFKTVKFRLLNSVAVGYHAISGDEFASGTKSRSSETDLNLCQLYLNPLKWLSVSVGADYRWDNFAAGPELKADLDADGKLITRPLTGGVTGTYSMLHVQSVTVPVALDLHFGSFGFKAGAEFIVPIAKNSSIKERYTLGNTDYRTRTGGVTLEKNSWDCFATLTFAGFGLFYRYYPKGNFIASAPFSFSTAGMILDFGLAR